MRTLGVCVVTALAVGVLSSPALASKGGRQKFGTTLYVSPTGSATARDRNCRSAAFSTVQSAVNAASLGSTVVVCGGTYTEDVIVSNPADTQRP